MKKTILIIITVFILLTGGYFGYINYKENKKYKTASQDVSEKGLNISLRYNSENWSIGQGDGVDNDNIVYSGGYTLSYKKDPDNIYIYIDYERKLNPPTPEEAMELSADSGAPLEDGMPYEYKDDELRKGVTKVTELRGQSLYVDNEDLVDLTILQKVGNGYYVKMPLLNKNPQEIIPWQGFTISSQFIKPGEKVKNEEEIKKLREEFIEIVKSIKITEIEK